MLRFAWLALVAGSLLPLAATAQTTSATQQGFAFCTVTDTGSAQAKIWASPIVPVAHASSDPGGFKRSLELASEFHTHVGTLGGAGDKQCIVQPSQAEVAASRQEQQAIWDKRVYFIKIGDWRDVAWAPAAWNPATAAAQPAQLTKYFYCYNTQTDVPDRSDLARTVASQVFAMPVPGDDPGAVYAQANAYAETFKQTIRAHGLPDEGTLCIPHDTQGEADKTSRDYRKRLGGFNTKFTEVPWMPTGQSAASTPAITVNAVIAAPAAAPTAAPAKGIGVRINRVGTELAQAVGLASPQGAWVVEVVEGGGAMKAGIKPMDVLLEIAGQAVNGPSDVPIILSRLQPGFQAPVRLWRERRMQTVTLTIPDQPAAATTASHSTPPGAAPETAVTDSAPDGGQYCAAFVLHSKSALALRAPIWEIPASQTSNAAMVDSLSRLVAAIIQANSSTKWMTFPPIVCYDNSGVHTGETFCFSSTYKHFGGSQMAGQFCNPSKALIDKRWADMVKADGNNARLFSWPTNP
jgi:hypothetical protein